ncbi:MAG: 50S ribosomal protein L10, partial [Candidatus Heimdallarchaeota archaeon]|nr:50S ribosomal protein L10 [Candidatus Heimdallarchaeota archaeon]MCK5049720.1 50S ribosomal protein L10 [Candidatus Heimdallarchaeota archaeon]
MPNEKTLQAKQVIVEDLKATIKAFKTISLVKIEKIINPAVQKIRKDLRKDGTVIMMAKNSLMKRAIDELKDEINGIDQLIPRIKGQMAFLLTNGNAFKIATYLSNNKMPAPAKVGQQAPNDVVIKSQNTDFPPGPVIGEFQSVGLKTRIEGGTIKIMQDTVVLEEGRRVNRTLAVVLARLKLLPFEAGLTLDVALMDNELVDGKNLVVDYDGILSQFTYAAQRASNLTINAAIPTVKTISALLSYAHSRAVAVGVNSAIVTTR